MSLGYKTTHDLIEVAAFLDYLSTLDFKKDEAPTTEEIKRYRNSIHSVVYESVRHFNPKKDKERWRKGIEKSHKDCLFYQQIVESKVDLPESLNAWHLAYQRFKSWKEMQPEGVKHLGPQPKDPNDHTEARIGTAQAQ